MKRHPKKLQEPRNHSFAKRKFPRKDEGKYLTSFGDILQRQTFHAQRCLCSRKSITSRTYVHRIPLWPATKYSPEKKPVLRENKITSPLCQRKGERTQLEHTHNRRNKTILNNFRTVRASNASGNVNHFSASLFAIKLTKLARINFLKDRSGM